MRASVRGLGWGCQSVLAVVGLGSLGLPDLSIGACMGADEEIPTDLPSPAWTSPRLEEAGTRRSSEPETLDRCALLYSRKHIVPGIIAGRGVC